MDNSEEFIPGLLVGVTLIIIIFWMGGVFDQGSKIQELGQSICDQEYKMDFDFYHNKKLKCKSKEIKTEKVYDGIVVQIT